MIALLNFLLWLFVIGMVNMMAGITILILLDDRQRHLSKWVCRLHDPIIIGTVLLLWPLLLIAALIQRRLS